MILSVATGFVTLFNAGAFIFLAPGGELSEYLSISVIYGTAAWLILWIVPALFSYDENRFEEMRAVQFVLILVALSVFALLHRSALSAMFAGLLMAEVLFFFPSLLLYEDRTRTYQEIDLLRALLNLMSMLVTFIACAGRPTVYSALLLGTTVLIGVVGLATFRIRFRRLVIDPRRGLESLRKIAPRFLASNSLALLGARAIEIVIMQILSWTGAMGTQLCFKVGVGLAQPISSNARNRPRIQVMIVLASAYITGLAGLFLVSQRTFLPLPASVRFMDPAAIATALPLVLLHMSLLLFGLRARQYEPLAAPERDK
jgi:hypothetical protein